MSHIFIKKNGFTLIEVVLVLGITMTVFLSSTFVFVNRQPLVQLDMATGEMLSVLRQAQNQSLSRKDGNSWGVYFSDTDNSLYTMYAGNNYENRDTAQDLVFDMGDHISWSLDSGSNDFIFSSINGTLINIATITIKHDDFSNEKLININKLGKIERND